MTAMKLRNITLKLESPFDTDVVQHACIHFAPVWIFQKINCQSNAYDCKHIVTPLQTFLSIS
jgi:hypothetical protein